MYTDGGTDARLKVTLVTVNATLSAEFSSTEDVTKVFHDLNGEISNYGKVSTLLVDNGEWAEKSLKYLWFLKKGCLAAWIFTKVLIGFWSLEINNPGLHALVKC